MKITTLTFVGERRVDPPLDRIHLHIYGKNYFGLRSIVNNSQHSPRAPIESESATLEESTLDKTHCSGVFSRYLKHFIS